MEPDYERDHQIVEYKIKKLREFTDDDLLLELRRRGRFARINFGSVIPMRGEPEYDPPESYLYPRMLSQIGREIGEKIALGDVILPGLKRERRGAKWTGFEDHYTIPLNFVVEKK